MIVKPELAPRELNVPCVYVGAILHRGARLMHDYTILSNFASTAASYALEAHDTQEEVTAYLKEEFQAHFGGDISVDTVYEFLGDHIRLQVRLDSTVPEHFSMQNH